jgi:CRISPR/Cas system-associated protein Cas5 (RAMP superfamily)
MQSGEARTERAGLRYAFDKVIKLTNVEMRIRVTFERPPSHRFGTKVRYNSMDR